MPSQFPVPFPTMKHGTFEMLPDENLVRQQDAATPVEEHSVDEINDTIGYTNLNLHRRIQDEGDRDSALVLPDGTKWLENEYCLTIHGVNSYRTTTYFLHTENSNEFETEIP